MKNRRKRYLAKGGDQSRLLTGILILSLVLILVALGLFFILADRNVEATQAPPNAVQRLLPWMLIVNVVGLIVVLVLAVFFTHKISGPVYHLIKDLRRLEDGDLTVKTVFRKGDRFKGLAEAMSSATARLRQDATDLKEELRRLEKVADRYPELKEKIEKLKESLDRLKT